MEKLWEGRFSKSTDTRADDFNSSISFDKKMYKQDIKGSIAHAKMLGATEIISKSDSEKIIASLDSILCDLENKTLEIDESAEDIHMFVESELIKRIGDTGKRLHTARSRNDQVALDIRMYIRDESKEIILLVTAVINSLLMQAEQHKSTIMCGYTHLQRAQPITFAQHLLAYANMFKRDIGRINDAVKRMNLSPLGACALAGTTYPTDRILVAELLEFDGITDNSLDSVSDRDFVIECESAFSILMMHTSRFCEELVMWSSWEFKFIELDDSFTTGSSIMPQKKNPDMAELIRGKTGRVFGNLMATLTVMKSLPLAYNKDMQEDKEAVFDSMETVKACLNVLAPMIDTMKINKDNMRKAAQKGFINATDLADYLVKKGIPFRSAYKTVGQVVAYCISREKVLESLTIDEYKSFLDVFEDDLYAEIALDNCVQKRNSLGGTSTSSVETQLKNFKL